MNPTSTIVVFGGTGMLGSAVVRRLRDHGYTDVTVAAKDTGFDLLDLKSVEDFLALTKPQYLFMVAGLVGGIQANNTRQADFLYQNALMILHTLEAVKNFSPSTKVLYTGSTCIYPKENPQPIHESRFMAGQLEDTNKGYAVAKGMGVVAGQLYRMQYAMNVISAMPTNMYGLKDNYDLENSHFIAAVLKKLVTAKKEGAVPVFWGTGKPRREALYVDDCADALIYLMKNYNESDIVNIGTGFDYSIKEYIDITAKIIGYDGEIEWDTSKPDGMYEKRTDISRLRLIMPEYNPRPFEEGARIVLKETFGMEV